MKDINCYFDPLKPQRFYILWFFLLFLSFFLFIYGYINNFDLFDIGKFIIVIFLESFTLRLMLLIYNLLFQEIFKKTILPIEMVYILD